MRFGSSKFFVVFLFNRIFHEKHSKFMALKIKQPGDMRQTSIGSFRYVTLQLYLYALIKEI